MTDYMLILRDATDLDFSQYSPDDMEQVLARYHAWSAGLAAEGRIELGRKLTDQGGVVLHREGEGVARKDGPYLETKEVVGGVYVIKADSYDHAARLCADHPHFMFGSIEIREIEVLPEPS